MGERNQEIGIIEEPWPHLYTNRLIDPHLVRRAARHFPQPDSLIWKDASKHECVGNKRACTKTELMPESIQALIYRLNQDPFVTNLGMMFGIKGLMPDPYLQMRGELYGAGIHQIETDGFLGIHCDYTVHPTGLARRLNLLLYLNDNWDPNWGGNIELWSVDEENKKAECFLNMPPMINNCVIFATSETSYHGHPSPLRCPANRTRNSLALYYYTATPVERIRNTKYILGRRDD